MAVSHARHRVLSLGGGGPEKEHGERDQRGDAGGMTATL